MAEERAGARPMVAPWRPPRTEWVVKLSKLCNLRCRYCYEYPHLGDATKMSLDQLGAFFRAVAGGFAGCGRKMSFVWHGGEPLLHKPDYFRAIFDLQRAILEPSGLAWSNSLQTNLTVVNDALIELLREHIEHIGVSFDVLGGQRVDRRGEVADERVAGNMQRLREAGLSFGCITVLSRANVDHVASIYRFFEEIETSFRLLPIYRTGYDGQQDAHALAPEEIVGALCLAVDLWLESSSHIQVRPVEDYVDMVVRRLDGGASYRRFYDKRAAEIIYMVDTDGSLYSNADAYAPALRHGNVFRDSFAELRRSIGYRTALARAEARMAAACPGCRYHGACSGFPMAEATPEQRWLGADGSLRCAVVQPVLEHVERRLVEAGIVDKARELIPAERLLIA
ncbi:MAG: radical SAM protein [Myxococcales bacterium]|nr:radical SAM protein [Myxococcales bacterium]